MPTQTAVRSVEDLNTTVVDADFHLTEGIEEIRPYVDGPMEKMLVGSSSYSGGVNPYPSSGDLHPSVVTGRTRVFNEEKLATPADVREGMDLLGIDRVSLDPGIQLALGMVHHDQVAAALATAYNEYLLDTFLSEDDGLYGSAVVAPQRPDLAAEEIDDRADESSVAAVFLPSGGVNPPLGDRRYDPIYDACERADLPLLLHNVSGGAITSFPIQHQAFGRHMPTHVVSHPMQHMVNLTHMLTTGVPERFPDLRIVFQEAGLGWVPYLVNRLDYEYYGQRQDAPVLKRPPSEYVDEQCYFTSQPVEGMDKPGYVAQVIRLMGGEHNLMFASDYPHHDFDHADDLLRQLTGEFDRKAIEAIFGGTATEVYRFR
ncbi:amidohydrolase family protein [Saliphagus infecundisoli]|uniref:Amidohydrolase family protein n=1 Tax=Saliphagus infecundisoli TaxID=1849069 RepID=A0ABD5QB17_9EURY|nr:amidohydrolase family protein [Saliphagus infecundisoli]